LSAEGTPQGSIVPRNGESDVPLPVPYSLDDAEGSVAASCDAVVADVAAAFDVDETELTSTGVSTGTVAEADWPAVDDVVDDVAETPEEYPAALVALTAGAVAEVEATPALEPVVAFVPLVAAGDVAPGDGAAVACEPAVSEFEVDEPPVPFVAATVPLPEAVPDAAVPAVAAVPVPAAAVPAPPVPVAAVAPVAAPAAVPEPALAALPALPALPPDDVPEPPVAVVLVEVDVYATWIGRLATDFGSKTSPRTSTCVSRPG
jgi:hypothetical protein